MTLSAHPSTGVLSDYASGALHTAPGVVVVAHLQFCPYCRMIVRTFEEVGGALLCGAPPERMGLAALGRVLRGIEEVAPQPTLPGPSDWTRDLPGPMAGIRLGARRLLGPGRWVAPVHVSRRRDWRVLLFRAPAGLRRQCWQDAAFICVLGGGFRRGGRLYRAGDFGEFSPDALRRLTVVSGGPLVALVAARRSRALVRARVRR